MVGLENWLIATPEMILAAGAMVLLMVGAFRGEDHLGGGDQPVFQSDHVAIP